MGPRATVVSAWAKPLQLLADRAVIAEVRRGGPAANSEMRQISDLTRRGDSVAERRPRLVGGARSTEAHALSHIDEHSAIVDADPGRVWCALGDVLGRERLPGRGIVARLLDAQPATRSGDPLLAGSTLPGFAVVRSEPHSELALEGRHRFASYALIFRLGEADGRTTIRAETRATFAGAGGRLYRALVISARTHALAVRSMLVGVRVSAER